MSGLVAWRSRTPRERAIAAGIAVLFGVALYLALVYALDRSRAQLRADVATLRVQSAKLDRQAAEIERLRALPKPPPRQGELRALIDAEARAAGFTPAQIRVEARGADEIQVVLTSVPFAVWLGSVARLEAQQARVETCRIEPLSTPGMVSVTATFVRSTSR